MYPGKKRKPAVKKPAVKSVRKTSMYESDSSVDDTFEIFESDDSEDCDCDED